MEVGDESFYVESSEFSTTNTVMSIHLLDKCSQLWLPQTTGQLALVRVTQIRMVASGKEVCTLPLAEADTLFSAKDHSASALKR